MRAQENTLVQVYIFRCSLVLLLVGAVCIPISAQSSSAFSVAVSALVVFVGLLLLTTVPLSLDSQLLVLAQTGSGSATWDYTYYVFWAVHVVFSVMFGAESPVIQCSLYCTDQSYKNALIMPRTELISIAAHPAV